MADLERLYDITEIAKLVHRGGTLEVDRTELFHMFEAAVNFNQHVKALLAEAGQTAVAHGNGPIGVLKLGFIYGAVFGILLEKEKNTRRVM